MKIIHFYNFDSDPRFPPFLLYVRWKSGLTFVQRCFRDVTDFGCGAVPFSSSVKVRLKAGSWS